MQLMASGLESTEYFNVGSVIRCTTCHADDIDGEVIAFDPATKIIVLKCSSSSGTSGNRSKIKLVNLGLVKTVDIVKEETDAPSTLPVINLDKVKKRQSDAIARKQRSVSDGVVSTDGQRLFVTINKTIDEVLWDGDKIVVMKSVVINPPYQLESVLIREQISGRSGKQAQAQNALDHVKKIVGKHLRELERASSNESGNMAADSVANEKSNFQSTDDWGSQDNMQDCLEEQEDLDRVLNNKSPELQDAAEDLVDQPSTQQASARVSGLESPSSPDSSDSSRLATAGKVTTTNTSSLIDETTTAALDKSLADVNNDKESLDNSGGVQKQNINLPGSIITDNSCGQGTGAPGKVAGGGPATFAGAVAGGGGIGSAVKGPPHTVASNNTASNNNSNNNNSTFRNLPNIGHVANTNISASNPPTAGTTNSSHSSSNNTASSLPRRRGGAAQESRNNECNFVNSSGNNNTNYNNNNNNNSKLQSSSGGGGGGAWKSSGNQDYSSSGQHGSSNKATSNNPKSATHKQQQRQSNYSSSHTLS